MKTGGLPALKPKNKENKDKMLETSNQTLENTPHLAAARSFGQMFGLHPAMAGLTLIVDMMLFPVDVMSLGTDLVISCAVGCMLAIIAFLAQRKWYGDDGESAFIKALILGLLTAIPTALPAVIYLPAGVVGLVHNLRRK
jgi:hypothetical protein